MPSAERLSILLAEYRTLGPVRDAPRLLVLLAEAATLVELIDEPAPTGPSASRVWTSLFAADPAAKPYAAPYFWAAFTISGE